jgi:hypothetical protein
MADSIALRQSRLLIPIFPLLAIIGAGAWQVLHRWEFPNLSLRRIGTVLVSLVLITTALKAVLDFSSSNVVTVLTGGMTREDYLSNRLGWHYVAMQSLNRLATDGQVLFLWEPRSLYCAVDCQPDTMIDNWTYARRTFGSPDQIAQRWQASGVRYVLLWRPGYEAAVNLALNRLTADDQLALDQLLAERLTLVRDFGGVYQLYRWRTS